MEMIKSAMWRLNGNDLFKGLKVAVFTAFAGALFAAFKTKGIDVLSYDWRMILEISITAGVGYLLNKFASDEQGKVLGKI